MRFKRFTAAMLAGVLMTFSMAGTAFAYTGETEPAESTASSLETEAVKPAETQTEKPAKNSTEATQIEALLQSANTWTIII